MMALADSLGLVKSDAVSFPDAVDTHDLISTASRADIGVIPYAPSSLNNRYCSPNKLSQYMAAGLPIFCNDTEFVKQVVVGNGLGFCVDFGKKGAIAGVVNSISRNDELRGMASRSKDYFNEQFHWEKTSVPFYEKLWGKVETKDPPVSATLDYGWICAGDEMRILAENLKGGSFIFEQQSYVEEVGRLNRHIIDQTASYSAEYARLNEHIRELNASYTAEYQRLNKYIVDQNEHFSKIITEQSDDYSQEIEQLTRRIEELTEASNWRQRMTKMVANNRLVQVLGQALVLVLPGGLGQRFKATIAGIIDGR